jgi:hypothetical protein
LKPTQQLGLEAATTFKSPEDEYIMAEANVKFFTGGNDDSEDPQDFLKGIKRYMMMKTFEDEAKIEYFTLCLKSRSPAEIWWNALPLTSRNTWAKVQIEFEKQWPAKPVTEKTTAEKQAMLEREVLKESELGLRISVGGIDEYTHVVWADKVEKLAANIPDTNNLLVASVRKALPKTIRKIIGGKTMTWAEFCKTVRDIGHEEILEIQNEERERNNLQSRVALMTAAQNTPSKALATTFRSVSINPIPQPIFTPRASAAPEYRSSGYPERTNAQRMEEITNRPLPHHPDTPAGHALYTAQVALWTSLHAGKGPNEFRPYPLTPGTEAVAANECWTCGHRSHRGLPCGRPAVPDSEQHWRRIAGGIRNRIRSEIYTAPPVNVVDVQNELMSREHFEADMEQRRKEYDYYENQGKGGGSSN